MPSFSCSTCKFADIAMSDAGPVVECHRLPPVGNPGGLEIEAVPDVPEDLVGELTETLAEIDFPRWPRVLESDWCGEYQLRPDGWLGESIPVVE